MKNVNSFDKIRSPIITEKATFLSEQNKVVFKVDKRTNKFLIKKYVEKIFKVNVIKINTITYKGKSKISKGKKIKKPSYKKAIITLKKGQSIDLTTGL